MAGASWSIDWDFEKKAVCFNCKRDAVQKIKMLPVMANVACSNCGAERIYSIHGTFGGTCDLETVPRKRKYDVWRFTKKARCPSCGNESEHDIFMDEFKSSAVCPACCFTHLYRFNVFTRGKKAN